MFPIPSTEKLVETKTCRHCSVKFPVTDKDLEFYEKVSPTFGGKKFVIPTPTLCPDCRQQRRLSFINERKLYERTCDLSWKKIISMYSPDKKYVIYDQREWWSDHWDPIKYGRDFDFSRGFFEQMNELNLDVPQPSILRLWCENSDYSQWGWFKNCYMTFTGANLESVHYSNAVWNSKNSLDMLSSANSENCYFCTDCYQNCSQLFYCTDCQACHDMIYCRDMEWCSNCYQSFGHKNKSYLWNNKQVSKEEYANLISNIKIDWFHKIDSSIKKENSNINTQKSHWNYLIDSKNCMLCFDGQSYMDCKYCCNNVHLNDCYDINWWVNADKSYETLNVLWFNILFNYNSLWEDSSRLIYCIWCVNNCKNCFACIGLRNKQYCILNKQYTKEEYEAFVPKIIEHMQKTGEWGEFFPSSISPFGYNETVASEYFPLTKSEAIKKDFNWSDYEAPFPKVEKIIPASKLPDDITKIPDDILNWAIECEVTKKPFRIIKQELEFYRKHNLPIPRRHPDQRHLDRMALRNPRKLFERKCDKCKADMLTTYAPERPEIVYCEACYNKEVIG